MMPDGKTSSRRCSRQSRGVLAERPRLLCIRSYSPGRRTGRPAAARTAQGSPAGAARAHEVRTHPLHRTRRGARQRGLRAGVPALGLEGVICKRRDLPYQPGRRDSWRKIKCLRRDLFVIGGFTVRKDTRKTSARSSWAATTARDSSTAVVWAPASPVHWRSTCESNSRRSNSANVHSIRRHPGLSFARRTGSGRLSSAKPRSSSGRWPACCEPRPSRHFDPM